MISQEFLDLTVMLLKEGWTLNYDVKETHSTMEEYFDKKYDIQKVEEAMDKIITENLNQIAEYPDDFQC